MSGTAPHIVLGTDTGLRLVEVSDTPVAITTAEAALLASIVFVATEILKAWPVVDDAPAWVKVLVVGLLSGVAAALEAWALGRPPRLAVLTGVQTMVLAVAAHRGVRATRHARDKRAAAREEDELL